MVQELILNTITELSHVKVRGCSDMARLLRCPFPLFSLNLFFQSIYDQQSILSQSFRTTHLPVTIRQHITALHFSRAAYVGSIHIHSQHYVDDVPAIVLQS